MATEVPAFEFETVDPTKAPRATEGEIVSAEDYFEKCSPSFAPELVAGVTDARGNPVYVAKLSTGGLDSYFKEIDGVEESQYRGAVLAFAIVRANGTRIFTPAHRVQLSQYPADEGNIILGTFYEVNGFSRKK